MISRPGVDSRRGDAHRSHPRGVRDRPLRTYAFERAEEGRAVRVGEKERSEAAAIVARYADLFTRDQLDALRAPRSLARRRRARAPLPPPEELRARAARARARPDAGRGAERAAGDPRRLPGRSMPLRNAEAKLAVLDEYGDREELGEIHADATATMNERRLDVARAAEVVRAELTGIEDPVVRSEDDKGISLRQLAEVVADGSALVEDSYVEMRDRWLDRLLGSERPGDAVVLSRRVRPPAVAARRHVSEGAGRRGVSRDADGARLRPRGRLEHPHRSRGPAAEVAAALRDRLRPAVGRPPHHPGAGRVARLPELHARGRSRAALRRLRPGSAVHVSCAVARSRADGDLRVPHRVDHPRARLARAVLRPVARSRRPRTPRRRSSSTRTSSGATRRSSSSSSTSGLGSPRTAARRRATPTG